MSPAAPSVPLSEKGGDWARRSSAPSGRSLSGSESFGSDWPLRRANLDNRWVPCGLILPDAGDGDCGLFLEMRQIARDGAYEGLNQAAHRMNELRSMRAPG